MIYSSYNYPTGCPFIDDVSLLCQQMFSSVPRSDQRRWAEVYVRGLLNVPGRKTVKRISAQIAGGGAEQCLQQFVNQSTWRSDLIRRDLALQVAGAMDPTFWVLEDVVIPKNGSHSAAVDKQFAHLEGRALNCQLGLGLFLSGDGWSCPVNWRLSLPASWENDAVRRSKAHIPPTERRKPRWEHMLDVIDEVAAEWMVSPRPVLGDLTPEPEVERCLRGLEERHLPYVMKVAVNRPAATGTPRTMTFGQLLIDAMRRNATVVNGWHATRDHSSLIRVIAVPLASPLARPARQRCLVAEWPPMRDMPRSAWVTSFPPQEIARLLDAIECYSGVRADMNALYEELGLRHFEGRSFVGWHHYATLVSVASACRLLCQERPAALPDGDWLAKLGEPAASSTGRGRGVLAISAAH
jgi:SRSO17 transposase